MKLGRWVKAILISSCVLALTACHSTHKKDYDQMAVNDANAAYNGGDARTSGIGEESSFGDRAGGQRVASSGHKGTYYFDFDSNIVHEEDKPTIVAHGNYLANHSKAKVMLEGHTDPRGSREYNIGLGERRAKAVAQIMTSRGASPSQIRVVSYGAEKLAASGHSEADYQQDRRAALVTLQR